MFALTLFCSCGICRLQKVAADGYARFPWLPLPFVTIGGHVHCVCVWYTRSWRDLWSRRPM